MYNCYNAIQISIRSVVMNQNNSAISTKEELNLYWNHITTKTSSAAIARTQRQPHAHVLTSRRASPALCSIITAWNILIL